MTMSSRTLERASSRDQGDADAGGDQPLDGLVVVALEGDVGLETGARGRSGRRGGRRGSAAAVCTHDSALRSSEAQRPLCRQLVALRERERASGPRAARSGAVPRAEPLATPPELEQQREIELPGAKPRHDLLGLALGEAQLDVGVRGAEGGDRKRHQRRAGGRERGHPQRPAAAARDRRDLRLGRLEAGEDPVGVARRARRRRRSGGRRARSRSMSVDARARASSVATACETADCV